MESLVVRLERVSSRGLALLQTRAVTRETLGQKTSGCDRQAASTLLLPCLIGVMDWRLDRTVKGGTVETRKNAIAVYAARLIGCRPSQDRANSKLMEMFVLHGYPL